MQYFRCKCGKRAMWGSGMFPQSCEGCKDCNTTLASHPDDHTAPEPHKPVREEVSRAVIGGTTTVRVRTYCEVCRRQLPNE